MADQFQIIISSSVYMYVGAWSKHHLNIALRNYVVIKSKVVKYSIHNSTTTLLVYGEGTAAFKLACIYSLLLCQLLQNLRRQIKMLLYILGNNYICWKLEIKLQQIRKCTKLLQSCTTISIHQINKQGTNIICETRLAKTGHICTQNLA